MGLYIEFLSDLTVIVKVQFRNRYKNVKPFDALRPSILQCGTFCRLAIRQDKKCGLLCRTEDSNILGSFFQAGAAVPCAGTTMEYEYLKGGSKDGERTKGDSGQKARFYQSDDPGEYGSDPSVDKPCRT